MIAPVYYVSPRFGVLSPDQMRMAILSDLARTGLFRVPAVIGHSRPGAVRPAIGGAL